MPEKKLLGEILIENGYLTEEDLAQVLEEKEQHPDELIGQVCIDLGYITQQQLQHILFTYRKRICIGEMLLQSGLVNDHQVSEARQYSDNRNIHLGVALCQLGHISEQQLCTALAKQFNYRAVPLADYEPRHEIRGIMNPAYAAQHGVVPVSRAANRLTVAISDPQNTKCIDDLSAMTRMRISVVMATASEIATFHERLFEAPPLINISPRNSSEDRPKRVGLYGRPVSPESTEPMPSSRSPRENEGQHRQDVVEGSGPNEYWTLESSPDRRSYPDAPEIVETNVPSGLAGVDRSESGESPEIVVAVNHILSRGLNLSATGIHLERTSSGSNLRFRIDGLLSWHRLDSHADLYQERYPAILSHLKSICGLDPTETRRPQDGNFRMTVKRGDHVGNVDFRVSVVPGKFGEAMVIRVLDQREAPASLEGLEMGRTVHDGFQDLIRRRVGLILVAGPTGSGKSTTLHAALRTIYDPGIKIVTAEDVIEYTHPGICQTEVYDRVGNTYARYLESFLRQDPDIIMVGELRDSETALLALRAVHTGHLVFSTVYANDSTSAVQSLLDLGASPSTIVSALSGVLAQRLVRRNCTFCQESYAPESSVLQEWFETPPKNVEWRRGRGCSECHDSGFTGRISINELWMPNFADSLLVSKRATGKKLRKQALSHTTTLAEDALAKVLQGRTTLEEALRVVPYEDIEHLRQNGPGRVLEELRAEAEGRDVA